MSQEQTELTPPPPMAMEESKTIPAGKHTGILKGISFEKRGDKGYPYVDVHIEHIDGDEDSPVIRAGYAANRVTQNNSLGQLLQRFGHPDEVDGEIDWSVLDAGQAVEFVTVDQETENGTFAEVVLKTLNPA